ncbi:hypothetical protein OS493_037380 [Desmophyllum pertusum]|uniref:Uncharacterized protein n=1 Tax=Desmophyllum pertusum TaxID=174260 RepID=A0A9X0D6C2_9CNID|nr:hypothetical protein OS493_037380 [Desmophyllum pertusum]
MQEHEGNRVSIILCHQVLPKFSEQENTDTLYYFIYQCACCLMIYGKELVTLSEMQILAFVLFLIVMQCGWASRCNKAADSDKKCDKEKGPTGFEKCIQLGTNSSYQCAVCLQK